MQTAACSAVSIASCRATFVTWTPAGCQTTRLIGNSSIPLVRRLDKVSDQARDAIDGLELTESDNELTYVVIDRALDAEANWLSSRLNFKTMRGEYVEACEEAREIGCRTE